MLTSNNFTAMMFSSLLFLLFVLNEPKSAKLFNYFQVIRQKFVQVGSMCPFVTEVKSKIVHSSLISSSSCERFCGLANRSTPSYANTMNRSVKGRDYPWSKCSTSGCFSTPHSGNSCFHLGSFLRNYTFLRENIGCKRNRDLSAPNLTQLGWVRPESFRGEILWNGRQGMKAIKPGPGVWSSGASQGADLDWDEGKTRQIQTHGAGDGERTGLGCDKVNAPEPWI